MKITLTSPIRAWHFNYAAEMDRAGVLHRFVTGAFRGSSRAQMPQLGSRLVRRDWIQTAHLASIMSHGPDWLSNVLGSAACRRLDIASYQPACDSDVFFYYRTSGHFTASRLHKERRRTLCVMEEVNTHVDTCHRLMKEEFELLGRGPYRARFFDHDLRLRAYEEADVIMCPSRFVEKSFLEKGFPPAKLATVNFGFGLDRFRNAVEMPSRNDDGVFRLLYVGQLNFRKGLRYAVEAFRRLKHPRKELLLVGPATKVTGLEDVTIPEGVRFAGTLKGDGLSRAYASADVFVLPTLEEGLALVLGEAMASGLPIVTTTHSGGEDLISDGVEGFITPPADTQALVEAFEKMASDPEKTEAMGHAARRKADMLGDWGAATSNLLSKFKEKSFTDLKQGFDLNQATI